MKPQWSDYFKCALRSTEKCSLFYSPYTSETTEDSDGGRIVSFGDDTDARPKPRSIYIPKDGTPMEDCPKLAYVSFNHDAVANGAPRFLTIDQHEQLFGATPWASTDDTASEQASA